MIDGNKHQISITGRTDQRMTMKRKVRKCCVPGCFSQQDQPPFPMFYGVPYRDKIRRRIWLKLLMIQNHKDIKKLMFVCQKHFETKFIYKDKSLKRHAYPTLITREEIEAGKSKKYCTGDSPKVTACNYLYWIGHYGFKALPDHTYDATPLIDYTSRYGFTLIPDHTYCVPQIQQYPIMFNANKEDAVNNNSVDKEKEECNSEDKQNIDINFGDKEKEEINLGDKENVEDKPNILRKRKKCPPLGSAERPLYYINDNKENKISNNPKIIIINNNNKDNNSTDNEDSSTHNFVVQNNGTNAVNNPKVTNLLPDKSLDILLAKYSINRSTSKVYKLLVDNNIISDNTNDNGVADDGIVNNDDNNISSPNMVIDSAEDPPNNFDNNISADTNPLDNNTHDLVVDHTEVIENIVQSNLNNEQLLENIVSEVSRIESSLSDTIKTTNIVGGNKELTEKLDVNEMALINYNNTVVLCRKTDVAELKNNYPELVDENVQIDRDLVTKVKRHKILRRRRGKNEKKQYRNIDENAENEEAVRNIPCTCDANTPCEHRKNPSKIALSRVFILCDECKEEHSVNYKFCKKNAPKPSPIKEIIKTNKDNRRRYVTVEKFGQMTSNVQKLLQTSQHIQGQINSLTSVITSLVTVVTNIEKQQKEMKKRKPRKPRTRRKKKVKETLPEEKSLLVNQHQLEERVNLREKRYIQIEGCSQEQESLPVKETLHEKSLLVNRYIPEERLNLREKRHLSIEVYSQAQESLPEQENLPEQGSLSVHGTLTETRILRGCKKRIIKKPFYENKCLPQYEILPVHGTLSTKDYLPGNRSLLEKQYLFANRSLPML